MSAYLNIILGTLFGLVLGSFGNSVVHRLPRRLLLQWRQDAQAELGLPVDPDAPLLTAKRSHCPSCGSQIAWYDNLPVVSWLLLAGKCRSCSAPISPRYLALEVAGAAIGFCSVTWFGFTPVAALVGISGLLLLWASVIDVEHQLLPDALVLPVAGLGLLAATQNWFVAPATAIYGALAGYLFLAITGLVFKLWRGEDGVGGGDAWLMLALGTFVGPLGAIQALAVACPIALAVSVAQALRTRGQQPRLPLGHWLAAGGATVFALQRAGLA